MSSDKIKQRPWNVTRTLASLKNVMVSCVFVVILLIVVKRLQCTTGSLDCFWSLLGAAEENDALEEVFAYDRYDNEIKRKDSLVAGVLRKSFITIGIPTVLRLNQGKTAFYLDRTIEALLKPLSNDDRSLVQVLLLLTDTDLERRRLVFGKITQIFRQQIDSGWISVAVIPHRYYLQIHNLPRTHGDSQKRMYWRSKQSLDYAFLWEYAQATCDYYLQIEDDVIAKKGYLHQILKDITLFNNKPVKTASHKNTKLSTPAMINGGALDKKWVCAEYHPGGFIGRLFPSQFLPMFADFIKSVYNEYPLDLMYQRLATFIGRSPIGRRTLFTHIGKQSSSAGT